MGRAVEVLETELGELGGESLFDGSGGGRSYTSRSSLFSILSS